MAFMDDLKYAVADIADTATNVASTAHLQIQMKELTHRRETLCAQIGDALLDRVRADGALSERFASTLSAIDAIDAEYESLHRQYEAVSAKRDPSTKAGVTCPACGEPVSSIDNYCLHCGARLK